MRRVIHACVFAAVFLLSAGSYGKADEVVCRAYIPTPEQRHGEVRLVRRGHVLVVQTLLYTPALRRGLQKIRQQEEANWPPDKAGHVDSQTYLAVLDQGKAQALEAFEGRADPADANKKLLIEVLCQGDAASVSTLLPELAGDGDAIEIVTAQPVAESPVGAEYARAAMEIILQSAFHRPGRTLEEFLSGDALRVNPLSDEQLNQPVTR